jgi:hypothetical protein
MPRRPASKSKSAPPPPPEFDDNEREAVLAVNKAFYRVASDRDFEAMDQLWAPTGPVFCFHPGQAPLLDRRSVMASWQAILRHPTSPRVRSADEMVIGQVGLAIVLCREIMPNLQLIATNTFVRQSARWHIIGHQSGVVPAVQRTQAGTAATPSTRDRRKLH